jgi:hypothetical protein
MTMHLMSPAFTTTGKKKGKPKFRNAQAAARARQSAESWSALLTKYDVTPATKSRKSIPVKSSPNTAIRPGSSTSHIPSRDAGASVAAVKAPMQYTGTAMIGIGQLHKSNAIPIFQAEDAVDISKMRRG